jgi:hypothetical protein
MKTYPIPAPDLQEIVNYLQQQRYIDVVAILAKLSNIVALTDNPPLPTELPKKPNGGDEAHR